MRSLAPFVAAQHDPIASRLSSPGHGIIHEQSTEPSAPVPLINDGILHQGPGPSAMGKVGHNEEHHAAYNLALVFGNQKLVLRGSANLSEDPPLII